MKFPQPLAFIILFFLLATTCSKENIDSITFFGDSHIARWDLSFWFPTKVSENEGVTGLMLLKENTPSENENSSKQLLIIELGINDLITYSRTNRSIEEVRDLVRTHYQNLLDEVVTDYHSVRLLSIISVTHKYEMNESVSPSLYIEEINEKVLPSISNQYDQVTFIDISESLQNDNGFLRERYSIDGLHLNSFGYELISNKIRPYLHE